MARRGGVGMLRGPLLALWDEQTSRREGRGRKKEEGVYILEYEKKGNEWCVWRRSWKKKVAGVSRPPPAPPKSNVYKE